MAITEVHHGCTREEQVRWLHEMWSAAERERGARRRHPRGHPVGAVRHRRLALAAHAPRRHLRRGAFDTRGAERRARRCSPRPPPSSAAARRSTIRCSTCPAGGGGRVATHRAAALRARFRSARRNARPILITGATGTLGPGLRRICAHRGLAHVLTGRAEIDIADEAVDRRGASSATSRGRSSTPPASCASPMPSSEARRMLRDRTSPGPNCWPAPAPRTAFRS